MASCRNGRSHKHRREGEAPHRSQRPALSPHHSKAICVIYQVWLYQHHGPHAWIFKNIGIFVWGDCVVCKCVCVLCVCTGAHGAQMLASGVLLRNQPPWYFFSLWVCFFFSLDFVAGTRVSTEEARVTVSRRPHLLLHCPGTGLMCTLPTKPFFFFFDTKSSSSPHSYTISIYWPHFFADLSNIYLYLNMWLWPRSPLRNATASGQYTVAKGARKSPRKYKVNHTHLGCPWQSQDLPLWIIILHFKNRQDTCWCREKRCKLKRKNMK